MHKNTISVFHPPEEKRKGDSQRAYKRQPNKAIKKEGEDSGDRPERKV